MTSTANRATNVVTRNLQYNENGQLISLSHGTTTKFEFGYGYDGARRWSKDTTTNVWSWLPCGVQCSAGELVEMQSTNNGGTWSTVSTNLAATSCGGGLIRAGSSFLYTDFFGQVAQTRDASRNVQSTAVFDAFGVQRFGTGSLASGVLRNTYGDNNEDGMSAFLRGRQVHSLSASSAYDRCKETFERCLGNADALYNRCVQLEGIEFSRDLRRCRSLPRGFRQLCIHIASNEFITDTRECHKKKDAEIKKCEANFDVCLNRNY